MLITNTDDPKAINLWPDKNRVLLITEAIGSHPVYPPPQQIPGPGMLTASSYKHLPLST